MSKRKPVIRKAKPEPPVVKQEVESDEENNVEAQMIQVKQEVKEEPVDEVEAENVEEQRGDLNNIISDEEDVDDPKVDGVLMDSSEDESNNGALVAAAAAQLRKGNELKLTRPPPNKKHTCLQSEIPTSRSITGADACSAGNPASLPIQKVKLHYVVHYLHRGVFNHIVPELTGEERKRVEGYECNICAKKFKNNVTKGEFPARGSFVCHLATDHGKILDMMRNDKEVDMSPVIDLLKTYDPIFHQFTLTGTKTDKDDNLVTEKESLYWRMNMNSKNNNGGVKQEKNVDSSTAAAKPQAMPPGTFYPPRTSVNKIGGFICPKCKEPNRDTGALRIHMHQHYKKRWEPRLKELKYDLESTDVHCNLCKKKMTGGTPSGSLSALICHWAIHHGELKQALKDDPDITQEFIEKVYTDNNDGSFTTTKPAGSTSNRTVSSFEKKQSVLSVFDKNHSVNGTVGKRGRTASSSSSNRGEKTKSGRGKKKSSQRRKSSFIDDEYETSEDEDEDEEDEDLVLSESSDEDASAHKGSNKKAEQRLPIAGQENKSYIRKRTKINFTLDSDDDSDEWSSGKKSAKKMKRRGKASDDNDDANFRSAVAPGERTRNLPRRASAAKAKFVEGDISDEEDI